MSDRWYDPTVEVPPQGVPVRTMDSVGVTRTLIYQDGFWFLPDWSMYVYYTPKFWTYYE